MTWCWQQIRVSGTIFIDLTKAFDLVVLSLLLNRLYEIVFLTCAVNWFIGRDALIIGSDAINALIIDHPSLKFQSFD